MRAAARTAAFILASGLAACAGLARGGGPSTEVRAAAAALAADYERARAEDFFSRLHQDEFPAFDRFRYDTRQFLLKNKQITLDLRPDRVAIDGDAASLEAHWNKSFVDPDGVLRSRKGECELIFARRESGGWALAAVRGDSPF